MITTSRINSSFIEKGKRILKIIQFGVKTAIEVSSFGDDSNPIENLTAIYSDTSENGESVILGYINENQLSKVGEKRIYSLKGDGSLSSYFWLKNDGSAELLGANDNLVRYEALNAKLQEEITKINAELLKVQASLAAIGGVYVNTPLNIDFSSAKVEEVKVI